MNPSRQNILAGFFGLAQTVRQLFRKLIPLTWSFVDFRLPI